MAVCRVCKGTGADPLSDNLNWLPCSHCGGSGQEREAIPQEFDDVWNRYMGRDVTPEAYAAAGWNMTTILDDLAELWNGTPDELSGPAMMDVANAIAAEFEARGYPVARDVDTVTLTTNHAASSYGRPVLLLDGAAYGPADMTPAGIPAGELVTTWAARFIAALPREVQAIYMRPEGAEA